MNWFPGPSVEDERTEELRHLNVPGVAATPWRHNGVMLRIVFGILAIVALAALFGFFAVLSMPKEWLTGLIAIGTAEWLIRRHHFFATGLESALWISGAFVLIFTLPSSGKIEAILVFALAAGLAGWRMRDAFFGVIAAVLVIAYVAAKWQSVPLVMIAASILALTAAVALRRAWQRPSTNWLLAGIALVMPPAGYAATIFLRIFHNFATSLPLAMILAVTAILLLAMGVLWRDRVLLISGTISVALAAVELQDRVDLSMEAKLIAFGLAFIAAGAILARALRGATRGFVTTPVRVAAYDDAMQIGGIIAIAPHGDHAAAHDAGGPQLADSASPTDKSFGGAGAGGGF
ncbi:MAG: hypothetical protein QOC81_409 [Thermoanaerobaculia bacterium]|jgi:hypothetical protein|nr:hypothetical protein [Thermoanaerobaculia bacterium]